MESSFFEDDALKKEIANITTANARSGIYIVHAKFKAISKSI